MVTRLDPFIRIIRFGIPEVTSEPGNPINEGGTVSINAGYDTVLEIRVTIISPPGAVKTAGDFVTTGPDTTIDYDVSGVSSTVMVFSVSFEGDDGEFPWGINCNVDFPAGGGSNGQSFFSIPYGDTVTITIDAETSGITFS